MDKGNTVVTIRISGAEAEQLDRLVRQIPGAKRSGIVRSLLADKLAELGGDARKLIRTPEPEGA